MTLSKTPPRIERFGDITEVIPLPNLTEVQVNSFKAFLQDDKAPDQREDVGLQSAFREVFPIDESEKGRSTGMVLDFIEYRLGEPEYSPEECREKDLTYEAPLYVKLELIHKDTGVIKGFKPDSPPESWVFLGNLPLMTFDGSFIINGADRVVISQIHRSPGVYFTSSYKGIKKQYTAAIIPMPKRGPWIELEFAGDVLEMKVNKRKFPVSLLLRVLGMDDASIRALFTEFTPEVEPGEDKSAGMGADEALLRLFTVLRPGDPPKRDKAIQYLFGLLADPRRYDLGEPGRFKMNTKLGVQRQERTLLKFEDGKFSDAGLVDTIRYLMALQQGLETVPMVDEDGVVTDVPVAEDDIDHLGNRRVRTVGELLADQLRVGMGRMARGVRERMLLGNPDAATPTKLVNNRPIVAAMREFFGRSQLSQFKDQTNPLSDLRHKRRISALGPGGLTRERAGFDVRDVHRTHYGRICPIETPEGANIGLISSLSSYAKVNDLGFIMAPYRKVEDGKVTNQVEYMTADIEDRYTIAQANSPLNEDNTFADERVLARRKGDPLLYTPDEVDYMDVSPKQIVSINTSLIPFLEHDDANRALMGSNMQSQAVPLVRADSPAVGTGVERRVVTDSGTSVVSDVNGRVSYVDARAIQVTLSEDHRELNMNAGNVRTFELIRFTRSNQGTNLDQHPIVSVGDEVKVGQVIADGPASERGRLALGQNITIAIMPFDGFNFEDAICINEDLVRQDFYTSVHIEKDEIEARDTKLGPEKITRDIPGLSEAALRDLDEDGIVRVGAEVKPGDILVGKTSFKGESEPTPEERLLRSIFGEKAREVKDTSLRVQSGQGGIVVKTVRFRRGDEGVDLKPGVREMVRVYVAQKRQLQVGDKVANRHGNKGVVSKIVRPEDMPYLEDGTPVDIVFNPLGVPSRMNLGQILETHLGEVARLTGQKFETPVFDSVTEATIKEMLEVAAAERLQARKDDGFELDKREQEVLDRAGKLGVIDAPGDDYEKGQMQLARTGKSILYDGRTGEPISGPVVVGIMYVMKLYHMVEDKLHARSTGPYSLITQQPLGGKAQFGGQRFGEMEVWALEAYGAAHVLQEMLTIKSDDIDGRDAAYQSIVKGEEVSGSTIPESFKVLVKELHSLGLDVEVLDHGDKAVDIFEGMMPKR
ncbi:DNA-directed RNA polymerase subunit beta [Deinococcus radiodurans]|mgnify:CR=1 FL=1|jgi:DNA-directed RNA polymerase subunit beta (EC 2.7.7.6)|uniref:DNA-directed RNA polymerase subunit beta n=1 Tax=Deinococcus radiodurans (strain ATCC 13939 / DSM 20539 / JCM 16871 / CCUG 27074 / LMG 4051 / NBRC 15346 / NCIMB 9279 / VKM B-1422 / R1) TaxID=243230 RepID=RPOB_DEIRA|nr:DNA-directed RNA polymerase subunit beta [Deinococcus radiodurans]Q9RVV9.2 RecName: Full=DNA-directed RNA polymerase subunit beta; Short=RNAP subunit beta; AltName: Full=RNA polymerase subunit beta; AltName: Full=Transcriptase subunit beta [Deinococcus radiodurans R1 = ATCC 13939 = DSM 20539]ANC71889.1 DNA-directed RNA polymerase subunit beta [Deinococcus radiodurans R1 = ATCC 13939 = DSM 20539]QIP29025.1 DNA-directed RNA polymerase subunit beta [Deinococcus radiodurans]UID69906.1 DNA-direct